MDEFFLAAVGFGCLVALADWKKGLAIAIVLDCVRDPVRKLTPGEPTLFTYIACLVWAAAFFGIASRKTPILKMAKNALPKTRRALYVYLCALLPGAALSISLYSNGFLIAGLGLASYAAPLIGIAIGLCLMGKTSDLENLLRLYVLVNSVALIGSVLEFLSFPAPALGGLQGFTWIRQQSGGIEVKLVSGFFRSPDMAGFHAANAMMASAALMLPKGVESLRWKDIDKKWFITAAWTVVPLVLCGRRKMIIIPIAFAIGYLLYMQFVAKRGIGKTIMYLAIPVGLLTIPLAFLGRDEDLSHHQAYLSSTFEEAIPRLRDNVAGTTLGTIEQSGLLGSGLGVATQGAQHFAGEARRGVWQEDGISRLVKELGVPGALLVVVAGMIVIMEVRLAVRTQVASEMQDWQALAFGVLLGNFVAFAVSHQHISGDPINALWILLFLGVMLGAIVWSILLTKQSKTAKYG